MRFIYFLLGGLIFISSGVTAQIGYGPEVGFNLSNYTGKVNGKNISNSPKYGGMFGGDLEIEMTDHFFFLPGLFYYRNGYATNYEGGTKTLGFNTFELPVNIEYKFGPPRKVRFFLGAGAYVGYNQGGTVIVSAYPVYSTYNINRGNNATDDIRKFDVGASGWGVFQVTRGLFLRARYQYGFLNMLPHGDANNSLNNRSFSLSVGYIFPGDMRAKQEPKMEEERAEKKEIEKRKEEREKDKQKNMERESAPK